MMEAAVTIPPFERFYAEHRDEVYGVLVRRLGRQRAEDAFQETFLAPCARTRHCATATICAPGC